MLGLFALKRGLKQKSQKIAAKELINFWKVKGMNTQGLFLFDGSGLSRLNAISARQFVFLLNYMKNKSKNTEVFINTLPVAGQSGTLKYFGRNTLLAGNLKAKSGSVERVRAFAGYIRTKSGREVAFALNIANYNCSSRKVKQKMQELLVVLANFNK